VRIVVVIGVLVVAAVVADRVLALTGMPWPIYVLLVLGVAFASPFGVRSWHVRHPDRCEHCRGRGSTTFVAARRLRTRRCSFCHGTGRIDV